MTSIELLKFMLPDFLVDHFDVVSANDTEEILHLYFEEKIKPPEEFNTLELVSKGFQDEKLLMDKKFRIYFQDVSEEISKYTGMACLVMDETGELLLFVIGNLNNGEIDGSKSKENILTPLYGDLYKIPGLPTSIQSF